MTGYLGSDERDRIRSLATHDPAAAIDAARRVPDVWRRVQSMAIAAWYAREPAVAVEAIAMARSLDEPNRIVSVSAWPLRVLVEHRAKSLRATVDELLDVIAGEPNPVRRADALILMLTAVFSDESSRNRVLASLVQACTETYAWKASWVLYRTALVVASVDHNAALQLAEQIRNERRRRQAFRDLTKDVRFETPELFWWAGG